MSVHGVKEEGEKCVWDANCPRNACAAREGGREGIQEEKACQGQNLRNEA